MPTITDVAGKAQVSKSTVSRVLNQLPVKERTRLRVLAAIEELGYRPNAQARGLPLGRTNVVGVVVPEMDNPFHAPILEGVQRGLWTRGFAMMVSCTQLSGQSEWDTARLLSEKRIDGLLLITPREPTDKAMQRFLAKTSSEGFPVVVLDGSTDHSTASEVRVDNVQGGYQAVEHLLQLGHRKIGVVLGHENSLESRERLAGYQKALQAWDISYTDQWVWSAGGYSVERGRSAASQWLAAGVSALFITSDDLAVGAMEVLQQQDVRIPQDLSIVGYDDVLYADLVKPKLTTVRQPLRTMGEISAAKLVKIITGEEVVKTRTVLSTELIVRESTAALHQ